MTPQSASRFHRFQGDSVRASELTPPRKKNPNSEALTEPPRNLRNLEAL